MNGEDRKFNQDELKKQCLAAKLKYLRENAYLTQQEVSDAIGVLQPQYARYEKALVFPKVDTIKKLAKFYNVAPEYILYSDNIGFTYDETDNYTLMTLTVPKNKLNLDRDKSIDSINTFIKKFNNEDLSFLCSCSLAIDFKNEINAMKKEYGIEGERVDTIISNEPLDKVD